ncbi:hypothetical protein O6H91_01G161800 [Diphasiastrum complanatum]|uniref:Uncharacterized protein n=1 Tax=Diphasiastrum complanatum TaxID=34168 RepID=A0ACC2EY83_DIPCM|nr:hypothetical protein O6H91_01G161800 [Diphasiastrum complanatum]
MVSHPLANPMNKICIIIVPQLLEYHCLCMNLYSCIVKGTLGSMLKVRGLFTYISNFYCISACRNCSITSSHLVIGVWCSVFHQVWENSKIYSLTFCLLHPL